MTQSANAASARAVPEPVGEAGTVKLYMPEDVVIIGKDTADGAEHPLYDDRVHKPLDPAKVANVKKFGPVGYVKCLLMGGFPVVWNGRTSTMWTRAANAELIAEGGKAWPIKVIIEDAGNLAEPDVAADVAAVTDVANVTEPDDPMTEARKIARHMGAPFNRSVEECAVIFAVSVQTIHNRLRLLKMDSRVHDIVRGKGGRPGLSPVVAAKFANLAPDKQVEACESMMELGKLTDVDTASKVLKFIKRQGRAPKPHEVNPNKPKRKFVERVFKAAGDKVPTDVTVVLKWLEGTAPLKTVRALGWLADAIEAAQKSKAAELAAKRVKKTPKGKGGKGKGGKGKGGATPAGRKGAAPKGASKPKTPRKGAPPKATPAPAAGAEGAAAQ